MLIQHLKVNGLLSFGPRGIDLPLQPLSVLIGPNGSGKSNLLEVLALLRSAPTNLSTPVKNVGGVREWLWKGSPPVKAAKIVVTADYGDSPIDHGFSITDNGGRFEVSNEYIESLDAVYTFQEASAFLRDITGELRHLKRDSLLPEQSILSQVRDPELYPPLTWLQSNYEQIRLYRNWSFGPNAAVRHEQSAQGRADHLNDGGGNLALVLSKIRRRIKRDLIESLQKLYDQIEDFDFTIEGGNVLLFVTESGGREIPATRLSDGTLRYLCLLAILLHPDPPPLIAIEEPELGFHPDIIPHIAELLVRASERTQLVVTTHSRLLVEALGDDPSRVLVCEKHEGETEIRRLDAEYLAAWLKEYSLGQLWSMGEIGGNRW